jgi:hypothetical protein
MGRPALVFRDPDGLAIRLYTEEEHEWDATGAHPDSPWLTLLASAPGAEEPPSGTEHA